MGDARLGAAAVISGGVAVVGSHDGWVTGLDLGSGAVRWRYLAAPAQRLAIANGLLTSTWPVFGVADLGDGTVVASAGTHPELEGGVRIVALRSADGGLAWEKNIAKKPIAIPAGGRGVRFADRSFINAAPMVRDGRILIEADASLEAQNPSHLGRLEFAPDEDAAAISERISRPPERRR